ncbi:MAG: LPS-assembly protein LptD [Ignavibacteria bacterium]|nr:LPS-assembly protein LptD [Ignavibacteria bacterium]
MRIFVIILFTLYINVISQQIDSTNSNLSKGTIQNSIADSSKVDTTKTKKKSDIDAVVTASAADSLFYDVKNKKMYVFGSGELKYKQTDLKSGKIFINYDTNDLEAFGIEDTSDTAKVKIKQAPILAEGTDVYEGARIKYNFKTQRGFISMAKNKEETSRYEGEKVKKVDKDTYFIEHGIFTTCELDTPHTHFTSSEMKIIQRDKIIAKWIFMNIGGVPFPIPLPFAVFPNEAGRRSGLVIPTYGQDALRGQYFRNFGYFLALSDYFDFTVTGDYYSKGGYGLQSRVRYAKRYDFSGNLSAGYSKIIIGEENDPQRREQTDWNVSLYHNQQIDPTSRFDVNLRFQSSSYLRNNSVDYRDLLNQDIISNATYSKRWDESGNSLTLNYSRTQNLEKGDIYESLPNINFTKNITYPFKREGVENLDDQKWYELVSYSYSGQLRNDRKKTGGNLTSRAGVMHNLSFNASPKIGYFSVSPRASYNEKWYNKRIKIENQVLEKVDPITKAVTKKDTAIVTDVNELNFVRTFDMSVSASTKLYGILQPNILGIEAFRHTVLPSISYSYKPDFGSDTWGYYDSYTNSKGEVIRYDKYQNEIFQGSGIGESQSLYFTLGNIFEVKMAKDPNDTSKTTEANKIQLLNLNASLGYNFAADSLKLSDLSLSYRTQIGELLSFDGSSSFTFYDFQGGLKTNRFLSSAGKGLFRLTNFNFSVSTLLSGEKTEDSRSNQKKSEDEFGTFEKKDIVDLNKVDATPDFSIPWNLSLSYNFNLSKPTPDSSQTYSNLSADLSFSLTKNWRFTVRGSYDFDRKEVSAPAVTIYRDLHCWEMNFVWHPIGTYRGFRFEIRMKAPELQDIKVTKSSGLYSGRR